MQSFSWSGCLAAVVLATAGLLPQGAAAGPLPTMDITDPNRSALAGDSILFSGVLTNRTGVALFSVGVDAAARAGSYGFSVQLQDLAGNLSDITTVTLNVRATGATVAEPSALALVLLAAFAAWGTQRRNPRAGSLTAVRH